MTFVTVSNGKGEGYKTDDLVRTPDHVAKKIIDWLPIRVGDSVLDPFMGDGAFYDQLSPDTNNDWCEIQKGRDFFEYNKHVDWIVSNPPYSIYNEVMRHSYEIADNIVYLVPLSKIVASWGRCVDLSNYGGIVKLWIMQASKCGFPFGFPVCAVWVKRGHREPIEWELVEL